MSFVDFEAKKDKVPLGNLLFKKTIPKDQIEVLELVENGSKLKIMLVDKKGKLYYLPMGFDSREEGEGCLEGVWGEG